jgi:hypothetical protein
MQCRLSGSSWSRYGSKSGELEADRTVDNSELKAEARNARRRSQLTAVRSGVAKLDTACINLAAPVGT